MTKKRSINSVENTIYGHIEICQFMRYNNIYQLIVLMNTSCQKLVVYMQKVKNGGRLGKNV